MEQSGNSGMVLGTVQAQDQMLGQVIAGKYQIERLLGTGGMGSVYEGKHLLLDRPIAIKVMQGYMAEDERAAARFLREAKAAAKIEHPNAVIIHDFGVLQGNIAYIVMEYIRGLSLGQWLNKYSKCEPEQTVEWLVQACEAVAAAHEQGIIHRDLKPENIMLKETSGGKPIVKVVDFGLAKLVSGEGSSTRITNTNEVIGTPYYMAPEFYEGEDVDQRADIYALGIIAYEMLSGKAPFTGTIETIIAGHLFKEVPSLHEGNSAIPKTLDEVIAKALRKKRSERFASTGEFAVALKASLATTDTSALAAKSRPLNSGMLGEKMAKEKAVTLKSTVSNEPLRVAELAEASQPASNDQSKPQVVLPPTVPVFPSVQVMVHAASPLTPVGQAGSRPAGKGLFIRMAIVVVALIGLGSGAAFWLGSRSSVITKQPEARRTQTVTQSAPQSGTPQPAGNGQQAVVIQENPESNEPKVEDHPAASPKKDSAQAAASNTPAAKPVKYPARSSMRPASRRVEDAKKDTELDNKEEKKPKKKGFFGKIKGIFGAD